MKQLPPHGSSGWAKLQSQFELPYKLDSGADHSVISEEMVKTLHKQAFLRIKELETPIEVELGDGSRKYVRQLASIDTELATRAGTIMLRKVEYRVLPGGSGEILIGKAELDRLNLPSLEQSLEAAVSRVNGNQEGTGDIVPIMRNSADVAANVGTTSKSTSKDRHSSIPAYILQKSQDHHSLMLESMNP